jgi:lipopolysaccharide/colanic/teichoic acid biosynthesis glycosyltransferase
MAQTSLAYKYAWTRTRVQLTGGLACVLAPFLVASVISPHLITSSVLANSLLAALGAFALGFYLFRSVTNFPGIQAGNYIVPVFVSVYAGATLILFFLRAEYSRPLLVASFALCLSWYFIVYLRLQRQANLHIGIVPFGEVGMLRQIDRIVWEPIDEPGGHSLRCSAIVADFRADMPDSWERYLADAALSGISVFHVKKLRESLTGKVEIEHLSENAHGSLIPQGPYLLIKQVAERIVAALLIVALIPVLAVVALMIRVTSPGPAFFCQRRIGHRGAVFMIWKFRTMTHRDLAGASSEQIRNDAITLQKDVRITRLGHLLRRSRIDEIPQLFNVVRGQMSLIGPRPEAEVLSSWYQNEIPFYRYRHIIRPGITGWAQVNQGHVADVNEVHAKLHYDFYYITNFSLWLDVLILLRTIRTIMTGFGSK